MKKAGELQDQDLEKASQIVIRSIEVLNNMEILVITHLNIHGCCKESVNCPELGVQLADLKLPLIREMMIVSPSGHIERDFLEEWNRKFLQVWSKTAGKEINPQPQFSELCQAEKYPTQNIFYLGCDEPVSKTNQWINKKAAQLEKFGKITWLVSREFSKHIVFQSSSIDLIRNLELPNDFLLIMMPTSFYDKVRERSKLDFKDCYGVVLSCDEEGHE